MGIVFGGLGISKDDFSLKLLEKAKDMDEIYVEFYTSLIPGLTKEYLEGLFNKKVKVLERDDLEEKGNELVERAKKKKIMILVPGDPMLFTTHHSIWVEAKKARIKTEIIHSTSIYSAAISSSGLQVSKFGRSVTLPLRFNEEEYANICKNIAENKKRGLHTLVLMEVGKEGWLSVKEAVERLVELDSGIDKESRVIVLARLGSENQVVEYDTVENVYKKDFGNPPFAMIIPGKLHFAEEEFLGYLE